MIFSTSEIARLRWSVLQNAVEPCPERKPCRPQPVPPQPAELEHQRSAPQSAAGFCLGKRSMAREHWESVLPHAVRFGLGVETRMAGCGFCRKRRFRSRPPPRVPSVPLDRQVWCQNSQGLECPESSGSVGSQRFSQRSATVGSRLSSPRPQIGRPKNAVPWPNGQEDSRPSLSVRSWWLQYKRHKHLPSALLFVSPVANSAK